MQGLDVPVWQLSPSQYLAKIGVHEPWIAEIAPSQYARLSERGKREYERKRAKEWEASIRAKEEWKRLVIEAFDRGEFTLASPGVSDDARRVIYFELVRRKEAVEAEKLRRAGEENRIKSPGELVVGDVVWDLTGREYVTVTKVSRKSVRARGKFGEMLVHFWDKPPYSSLEWKSPDDLKHAVELGLPIKPVRRHSTTLESSTFEADVERHWNSASYDVRHRILDSALPKEYGERDLKKWASFDWRSLPIFVKDAVKLRYKRYWGLEPKVEVKEELRMYYQVSLEPSVREKEMKFPAPVVRKPEVIGKEEVEVKKSFVERRVEPGLARFGIHKPEQPPIDFYLKQIEFEKQKQKQLSKKLEEL